MNDFETPDGPGQSQLKALSKILIEPLQQETSMKKHIIFIPSGVLTRVPFSTLLFENTHLILQKEVSQVPSLTLLHDLVTRQHNLSTTINASIIARPGNYVDRWLPMAGMEAAMIANTLGTEPINAKTLDRKDLQDHFRTGDFLHICTHVEHDAEYPFNSRLLLKKLRKSEIQFRVVDMLAVNKQVVLVTFSACLSGIGNASENGDVQGFSHAVLQAGANAYIGALWKANDLATMLHMHFFYTGMFAVLDQPSIAEAWRRATIMLYNFTPADAVVYLKQFVGLWEEQEAQGKKIGAFIGGNGKEKLLKEIETFEQQDPAKPVCFQYPKYWAAFALVGNGSLRTKSQVHSPHAESMKAMRDIVTQVKDDQDPNTVRGSIVSPFLSRMVARNQREHGHPWADLHSLGRNRAKR
jgi:CHAT domain-containing protein